MPDSHPNPKKPTRRASDVTAHRLGRAILAYLVAVTGIITLAPFRFEALPVHGLTDAWTWTDIIMNVVMFVPIGFVYQLTRPAGSPVRWLRVLMLGAALSAAIELAQLFAVSRFSSLVDLTTNSTGALLGAWCYALALRHIEGRRAVRTFALELPLMGLVYLLVPLMWLVGLASGGGSRAWLVLPIVAFAGSVMGTVFAAYLEPTRRLPRGWLVLAAVAWCVVSLFPGAIRDRDLVLACVAMVIGTAWLRTLATGRYRDEDNSRRFELPTLRLVMPLFAAYLALSSLWPLDAADGSWRFTLALLPAALSGTVDIFVALEHVAAFTMVGYIIAEFHGRDLVRDGHIARRVALWGGGLSVLLEIARGFHPAYQASALMVCFTVGAAIFGGWLYQLQRDHVRALLARRTAWTAPSAVAQQVTSNDPGALVLSVP